MLLKLRRKKKIENIRLIKNYKKRETLSHPLNNNDLHNYLSLLMVMFGPNEREELKNVLALKVSIYRF